MERPILFNTDMVKAILEGRKTQTRRVIKSSNGILPHGEWMGEIREGGKWISGNQSPHLSWAGFYTPDKVFYVDGEKHIDAIYYRTPCQPGDTLWVRETWFYESHMEDLTAGEPDLPSGGYSHRYVYRASSPDYPVNVGIGAYGWRPSIHMPREAARIFLNVKEVRVERLQDITEEDAIAEGFLPIISSNVIVISARGKFHAFLEGQQWDDNPWVWVIEFERC